MIRLPTADTSIITLHTAFKEKKTEYNNLKKNIQNPNLIIVAKKKVIGVHILEYISAIQK